VVFTSLPFVVFFSFVLLALALCRSRSSRQLTVLLSSIVFYGYWNTSYLLLLLTPSIIDYYCAHWIEQDAKHRRLWLITSIISNLGLLMFFKYANFFLDTMSFLSGRTTPGLSIVLPIGISFYTLKTLSYTIDVYRGELRASYDWWKYAMFVTYFPELIAGPIVRASLFLPQMTRSLRPSWPRAWVGFQIILLGVTKKLLIADRMAPFVDSVFAHPRLFSPFTVASAVVAYSLQIYCDFSGYSDIAIGVSRIIGFDLPENFNLPYLSTSVTDFWRRWHMTLSQWLRDYLYIPLGGNRRGRVRMYINLTITMLLGGLWHGASWTFVIWGLLHGIGLAVHKYWQHKNATWHLRVPPAVGWLVTYAFVCFCWIFFRAPNFSTASTLLRKLVFADAGGASYVYLPLFLLLPVIVLSHWLGHYLNTAAEKSRFSRRLEAPGFVHRIYEGCCARFATKAHSSGGYYVLLPLPGFFGGAFTTTWVLSLYLFCSVNTSPFIYFQF
jgi:alginate O-acetyltransferase complex protein AlgI